MAGAAPIPHGPCEGSGQKSESAIAVAKQTGERYICTLRWAWLPP